MLKKSYKKKIIGMSFCTEEAEENRNTFNKPFSACHPEIHNHVNRDWMMCSQVFIHFSPALSYASL